VLAKTTTSPYLCNTKTENVTKPLHHPYYQHTINNPPPLPTHIK
jgi:hypothetical protein